MDEWTVVIIYHLIDLLEQVCQSDLIDIIVPSRDRFRELSSQICFDLKNKLFIPFLSTSSVDNFLIMFQFVNLRDFTFYS